MTDSKERALTPRQQRFVSEYLQDLNATQAAIRAGYSEKTADSAGPRLLGNVRVRVAIEAGKAAIAERAEIDQDWVVERLKEVRDASMKETTAGTAHNPAAANRSIELIGKLSGMFQEGHTPGDVQILVNVHPYGEDES